MYLLVKKLICNSFNFSGLACYLEPQGDINLCPKPLFNSRDVDASCALVLDTQYSQVEAALHHVPT